MTEPESFAPAERGRITTAIVNAFGLRGGPYSQMATALVADVAKRFASFLMSSACSPNDMNSSARVSATRPDVSTVT